MPLPLPNKYNLAIQHTNTCFSDPDLKSGNVELDKFKFPKIYAGGFTNTFHVENNNNFWAVRCFIKEVGHLRDRYIVIDAFIKKANCRYLVPAEYLKNGIKVDNLWHPIIKMKWVKGDLFNDYISKDIGNKNGLRDSQIKFIDLVDKMETDHVAHGDLQHGNIIVCSENVVISDTQKGNSLIKKDNFFLIDYDGFYLPEISKLGTGEIGHPNYQHSKRSKAHFDSNLDRFSAIVIYLSLEALIVEPKLWKKYNNGENLIFCKKDFLDPKKSELFKELSQIDEVKNLTSKFASICLNDFDKIPSLQDFIDGNFEYDKIIFSPPQKYVSLADAKNKGQYNATAQTATGGYYKPLNTDSGTNTTQNVNQYSSSSNTTISTEKVWWWIIGVVVGLFTFGAILLASLNQYTNSPQPTPSSNVNTLQVNNTNQLYGIGVLLIEKSNVFQIDAMVKNSPAQKADLRIGDYIISIDDKMTINIDLNSAILLIRGSYGSCITLGIRREIDTQISYKKICRELNIENYCESDQCLYKDSKGILSCIDKPPNSKCVENTPGRAWTCIAPYNYELGNSCKDFTTLNTGCKDSATGYSAGSYFTGKIKNGLYVCDCMMPEYVWNATRKACVTKASIDQLCQRGGYSYYLGYVKDGNYVCK